MFKKRKHKKLSQIDTLIGESTDINGNMSFRGGLRIDGNVTGNIHAIDNDHATLTLSEHGSVEGEIKAPHLIINGSITGDVYSTEYVELASHAKIQGNVYYNLLEMAVGAEVNGQLIHVESDDSEVLNVEHDVIDDREELKLSNEKEKK